MTYDAYGDGAEWPSPEQKAKGIHIGGSMRSGYYGSAGPATPETDAAYRASLPGPVKTLRDEMAMAALTGLVSNSDILGDDDAGHIPRLAYTFADAMMKARG